MVVALLTTFVALPSPASADAEGIGWDSVQVTPASATPGTLVVVSFTGLTCDGEPLGATALELALDGSPYASASGEGPDIAVDLLVPDLPGGHHDLEVTPTFGACEGQTAQIGSFEVIQPVTVELVIPPDVVFVERSFWVSFIGIECYGTIYSGPISVQVEDLEEPDGTFDVSGSATNGDSMVQLQLPDDSEYSIGLVVEAGACEGWGVDTVVLEAREPATTTSLQVAGGDVAPADVTLTATVTGEVSPTGEVTFSVDGVPVGTVPVAPSGSGVAVATMDTVLPAGEIEVAADFSSDDGWDPSGDTEVVDVEERTSVLELDGPSAVSFGEAVHLTAHVLGEQDAPVAAYAGDDVYGASADVLPVQVHKATATIHVSVDDDSRGR